MEGWVHVVPIDDWIDHCAEGLDCLCEPVLELCDPDTGEWYSTPLVMHNAVDGRRDDEPIWTVQ